MSQSFLTAALRKKSTTCKEETVQKSFSIYITSINSIMNLKSCFSKFFKKGVFTLNIKEANQELSHISSHHKTWSQTFQFD